MSSYPYLILGGGMVAGYAAGSFVEQGLAPGALCMLSQEEHLPYERPPLSKGFLAGEVQPAEVLIHPESFYQEHGIEVRLGTRVIQVDFQHKQVVTANGERIGYQKLLLATGSRVRRLTLPGADLAGLHYLRSLDDARRLREAAAQASQALVIGAGYIGLEASASLARQGLATTVIASEAKLLPRLFTPEMSDFFQDYFEARGVSFVKQAKVTAIEGSEKVAGLKLDSGARLEGDLVLAGIGVTPATELFANSALRLDQRDRSICVDEYLETSLPGVYAAGDAVNYVDSLFLKRRHVEHWNNASAGGKHVARVMSGKREAYAQLPYFFSDVFDLSWEFWGDTEDSDRVVYRGELASTSFSVWWLRAGHPVAAFVMNRPDEEREKAPEWIQARRRVDPERLSQADQPLDKSLNA